MTKKGHLPIRMCLGCRQRKRKEDLIRLIQRPQGLALGGDRGGKGRGFYLCPDLNCLKKARKRYAIAPLPQLEGGGGDGFQNPVEGVH